jgi:hypothetical protein
MPVVVVENHDATAVILQSPLRRWHRIRIERHAAFDPGCVKMRISQRGAELFSKLPSGNRGCQYN